MANSSILGGESAAARASGRDTDALGPSDTSDSGSDVQGERTMPTDADNPGELGSMPVDLGSDSDAMGTGERGSAAGDSGRDGADILPDHIVGGQAVGTDEPFDAGPSEGVEEIADDTEEDDEPETDVEADHRGSRVFRVPAGTIEEAGGR